MSLTALQREGEEVVAGLKGGTDCGSAGGDGVAVEQSVHAIFGEVLIDADVLLLGVVVGTGVEVALIEDGRAAGDVVGAGRSTAGVGRGRGRRSKSLRRRLLDVAEGEIGGWYLLSSWTSGLFGCTVLAKATNAGSSYVCTEVPLELSARYGS